MGSTSNRMKFKSLPTIAVTGVVAVTLVHPASAQTPPTSAQSPPASALVQTRLFPNNLEAEAVDGFADRSPAVEVRVENPKAEPANSELALNATRGWPLDPVIPPYIAASATSFSCSIFCPEPLPGMSMRWLLFTDEGEATAHSLDPAGLTPGTWHRISFPLDPAGTTANPLEKVVLGIRAPASSRFTFYLADAELTYGDGKVYSLLSADPPMFMTGYDPSKQKPVFPPLPQRESLALGLAHEEFIKEIVRPGELPMVVDDIQRRFPGTDFIFSVLWNPRYLELADILPEMPGGFFYQMQKARTNGNYMAALDALPRTADGKKIDAFSEANATVASHPLVRTALKDEMDYAATLGVNNFLNPDYNWPWYRGIGYGEWTVKVFRENLAGEDEGLDLLPGPGGRPKELIHFHDYYEQNHGVRWTPADVGIASWSEFTPVSAGQATRGSVFDRRNYSLATALSHYEWLRQAQRFGRWAKAHGGTHEFMPNAEDVCGGVDTVYLQRLADAGNLQLEYFGSPAILRGAYRRVPMHARVARMCGKELGAALELGPWGHGQHYFSPEVGYLVAYELGALGFKHHHLDFKEAPWSVWSDPANAYHYDRYANAMSQGHGWWQARHEGAARPPARVFAVTLRSSVHYVQSGHGTTPALDSFEDELDNAHVDYEVVDTLCLPDILPEADVLFYGPPVSRRIDAERIKEWLDQGGKTLITHSYIPLSLNRGALEIRPGENLILRTVDLRRKEFTHKGSLDRRQGVGDAFVLHPAFESLYLGSDDYWHLSEPDRKPDPAMDWKPVEIGTGPPGDRPLVSELSLPNGSRIVYLHRRLKNHLHPTREDLLSPTGHESITALIERYKLPLIAKDDNTSDRATVHTFRADEYDVAVLWNIPELVDLGWRSGYGPHLLGRRYENDFDPDVRPYPIAAPGAMCGAWVPVGKGGAKYRVYAMLADRETTVEATPGGWIRLQVPDLLADQFYYAPDSPEFRAKIEELKARRKEFLLPLWSTIGSGVP